MAPAIRQRSPMLVLLALILILPGCSKAASRDTLTPAQVRVGEEILLQKPIRLGVNLGQTTYYSDQQIVANPFNQGGFSKGRQVYMMQVGEATENTVTDSYAAALTQSHEGGTHYIVGDEPFGMITYGMGSFTSYAYPAGLNLEQITVII